MAKARKKAWKKIDGREAEKAVEEKIRQRDTEALGEDLFSEDVGGNLTERQKRILAIKRPKQDKGFLSQHERFRIARTANQLKKQKPSDFQKPKDTAAFDLWDGERAKEANPFEAKPARHERVRTSEIRRPTATPEAILQRRKELIVPAVKVAHAGQSINPSRSDFESLVNEAAATELAKQQQEVLLNRRLRPVTHALIDELGHEAVKKMSEQEKYKVWMEKVGMKADPEVEVEPPVKKMVDRKTTVQRNAEAREIAAQRERKEKKVQKKLSKQLDQIEKINKQIDAEEAENKRRRDYVAAMREANRREEAKGNIVARSKVGKNAFEEAPLAVPMNEDGVVQGSSLRTMHHIMGSAARERFTSIFRRKLIEAPRKAGRDSLHKAKQVRRKNFRATKQAKLYKDVSLHLS